MKKLKAGASAKAAVLALAEIKAAVEAFDRGEINVFDALEAVLGAAGGRGVGGRMRSGRPRVRRRAA